MADLRFFYGNALHFSNSFLKAKTFIFEKMVEISTHLSLFNILSRKRGVKDGYQNTLFTNLVITMFYNLQNASFMHISSPINAIEDVNVGAFC